MTAVFSICLLPKPDRGVNLRCFAHAEKLAELLHGGENYGNSFIGIAQRFGISADVIAAIASYINQYLIRERYA